MAIDILSNIETNTSVISELPIKPEMSASELQNKFDQAGSALKDEINSIVIPKINEISDVVNSLSSGELGTGDMTKAVYDADGDGVVDNSLRIGGMTANEIMLMMNPVGTIKITTTNVNPGEYIGGTWQQWGGGRFILGLGTPEDNTSITYGELASKPTFTMPEATSGEYKHSLTATENGPHTHNVSNLPGKDAGSAWIGEAGTAEAKTRTTASSGAGTAHNNMPPYITAYMWKRIA